MRPTPRKLSEEEKQKFKNASDHQTSSTTTPKTVDSDKYPVFEVPVNDKRLIYVPKFEDIIQVNGEEKKQLRMDKGAFHSTRYQGSYVKFRCTGEISGIEGFDGTCPFDSAVGECWDLFNILFKEECAKHNVDPANVTKEQLKALGLDTVKADLLKAMATSGKQIYYTFPVFVFELVAGTLDPATNADGTIKGRLEWYQIQEKTYIEKWESQFQGFPDNAKTPAGKWFILDYTYPSEGAKHTKMQSASKLKVVYKGMSEAYKPIQDYIDNIAEPWDASLAQEVIYSNQIFDVATLAPIVDEIMIATRAKLTAYSLQGSAGQASLPNNGVTGTAQTPEQIAASFGATPSNVGIATPGAVVPTTPAVPNGVPSAVNVPGAQ